MQALLAKPADSSNRECLAICFAQLLGQGIRALFRNPETASLTRFPHFFTVQNPVIARVFWGLPPMHVLPQPRDLPAPLSDALRLRVLKIAAACFLAALFVSRLAAPIADLDMWHEIALIRESVRAGHLLTEDVFAYTPTIRPMVDHEWGAGALLYLVAPGGGLAVVALKYLLAALTAVAILQCARLRHTGFEQMTALAPLAIPLLGLGYATLRAHAYSFLFFAVLLYLLELDVAGKRRWIAAWLLIFVLWVNIHGGWVMGIIALGLHWFEQAVRRRPHLHVLGAIVLSVAAVSVNPYGFAYYRQIWTALTMSRAAIPEWAPIWRDAPWYAVLFWVTLAVAGYAVAQRGWRSSPGALIVAAMACGAMLHRRIVPFYAVAWIAYVPGYVSATPLGQGIRALFQKREAATVVCLVLAMFFAATSVVIGFWRLVVPNDPFPVGPVRYLADQKFQGNVMTAFEHGSYVTWRLYPAVKVSIDSRYETAFLPAMVDENLRFYRAEPDWRQTLAKYPTDVVLSLRQAPVASELPSDGWKPVYVDKKFEIFARPDLALSFRDDSDKDFQDVFP